MRWTPAGRRRGAALGTRGMVRLLAGADPTSGALEQFNAPGPERFPAVT